MTERIIGFGDYGLEEAFEQVEEYGGEKLNVRIENERMKYHLGGTPEEVYDSLEELDLDEGKLLYEIDLNDSGERQFFEFETDFFKVYMDRVVRYD